MNRKMLMKNEKKSFSKLKRKIGDDKLVISLVLIAVGVVLCFVYRDHIAQAVADAVASFTTRINQVFNSGSTTAPNPTGTSGVN